ncbi:hypothetical protein KFK09_003688 [Dendrobium nobile]|uniref:CCHC-type domain-containing protein n=1 Tax=Dendrobium nobile TaxID=94219 RepID=A0A8T3BY88_DENNO|nr:hypothetical protein KFK09_003688 [Dendrobium nobile]
MAESSRRVAPGGDNSLEALWEAHIGLGRRTEELESDLNRFYNEIRQELRAISVRLDRLAPLRDIPRARRYGDNDRRLRREPPMDEASDSGEEVDEYRLSGLSDSEDGAFNGHRWRNHRRNREVNRPHNEFRVKLDIPYFDGKLHIEDYLDWERAVETFFEYMEIEPSKQVKYVACRLKAGVSAWWQQVAQMRRREGRGHVSSWRRMKKLLRGHYLPTDYEQMLYQQYQHCRQGNRSVNEYTEEFYRLSARNNLNETANQLVARYIGGLKESIQDKLELNAVWSLSQAVNYALKVEMQSVRHNRSHPFRRSSMGSEQVSDNVRVANAALPQAGKQSSVPTGTIGQPVNSEKPLDSRIAGRGKSAAKENPYAKPSNIKCFRCFQQGHKSNECPSRPQLQLLDAEADEDSTDPEATEIQEDVEADVGEPLVCVIEKLLLAPKQPDVSQRNALFRTKCTVGGKVCDLLIDSGCTENVVSRAMVQALQLKTTKSSNPYKISWVKKGVELVVTELCKVTFSIGKHYVGDVLCDVLDMDVCHIILGRPWQYDTGAIYDCRANVYSFDWKGKRLRLLPNNVASELKEPRGKTNLFAVSATALVNAWRESKSIMDLIIKKVP